MENRPVVARDKRDGWGGRLGYRMDKQQGPIV